MGNLFSTCCPPTDGGRKGYEAQRDDKAPSPSYPPQQDTGPTYKPKNDVKGNAPPKGAKQIQMWNSTGIIGVRDRNLKELPSEAMAVGPEAKVLDASNNKIVELPPNLGDQLCNLNRLVLANNALSSLPATVFDGLGMSVKTLVLDRNLLRDLPEDIGQLLKLEKLSVMNNKLVVLPQSLGQCTALQVLNVSGNQLSSLPPSLSSCLFLEELDASSNDIVDIPSSFGELKKLKILNLDRNKLTQIPPAVFKGCLALQTLSLHSNNVTPDSIAETEGFQEFEERRQLKYTKGIAGGVLLGSKGMDEGVDRKV
eukprot:gene23597-9125_t